MSSVFILPLDDETGKGLLRSMRATPNAVADVVPVDTVVNLILSVGWYTAVHRPNSTRIYHCTSGAINPCKWADIGKVVLATLERVPLDRALRIPNTSIATSSWSREYWNFVSHWSPAAIVDLFLWLTGRKPQLLNIMSRLLKGISMLEYFSTHSWEWNMNNTELLMAELCPEDKQVFNFDVRKLKWNEYLDNYVVGVKQYLLKEDMSEIPKAKRNLKRLRMMKYLFNTTLVLLIWYLLITRSKVAQNISFFLVYSSYKHLSYLRQFLPLKI